MKKIISFTVFAFAVFSANAKIIDVRATGVGVSEYVATLDAIDNAIRQSNPVSMSNDKPTDVSERHMVLTDTRKIDVSASASESESASFAASDSVEYSDHSKSGSWFSRIFGSSKSSAKSNSKAEAKSEYHYKSNGGKLEFSDKSVSRSITAKYSGTLESYEVLSATQRKDGKYVVEINAKVKKLDEYESPDLVKKAKYTVAIITNDSGSSWKCVSGNRNSKAIENIIIGQMEKPLINSKKVSVVDRDNFSKQLKELGLSEKGIAREMDANKLKQVKIADYLLIVKVDHFNASTTTKTIELTGEKVTSGKAEIEASYRLIETGTMEIVASGGDSASISLGAGASCDNTMRNLAKRVGEKLTTDLLSNLN